MDSTLSGIEGPVYPGTCRKHVHRRASPVSWRIRTDNKPIEFVDALPKSATGKVMWRALQEKEMGK